ncbi:hypothetical protein Dsin_019279 [Dipteronia sinensis]|uniref:Uncharacterized protein n=1 Tax=Dipteronia sinensis TaxID=43782 RepID=A0AAE0A8A4_9ROSI|nr:hypothetical protein Dsin_019279 [Dipteronia sinensis]
MLIIQKTLYFTYMNDYHGCMSVSFNQIMSEFLTGHEEYLNLDGQKKVVFVEPSLMVSVMNFKRWNHGKVDKDEGKKSSNSYILQTFKSANDLKEGEVFQD